MFQPLTCFLFVMYNKLTADCAFSQSLRCVNCTSWLDGREEKSRAQQEYVARQ